MAWWIGIGTGVAVMGAHALLRVATHRLALGRGDGSAFVRVELGGLGARMAVLLGAVALVLAFVPVHVGAFVGTVLALLVLSLVAETRFIFRRIDQGDLSS
jgi:hypothetical protein